MVKIFRRILIITLSLLTMDASAAAYYIVKSGQTLSTIAAEQFDGPVYGEGGSIEKILVLNPKIKNPNFIFANQKIRIQSNQQPQRSLSSSSNSISNTSTNTEQPTPVVPEKNISEVKPPEQNAKPECVAPPFAAEEPTRSGVGIKIGTQFFRINSVDAATSASSVLVSEMSPTADLYWKLDLSESWTTRFGFSMRSFKVLQTDAASTKTLTNNTGNLNAMDFGVTYKWTPNTRTEVSLGTKEKIFLRATSTTTIAVEKVMTPVVAVDHSLDLYKASSITLGSHIQLASEAPGEGIGYKTKSGTAGLLGVSLSHQTKSAIILGEVYYDFSQQNSDLVEQKASTVGTKIGIEWRF